MMRSDACLVSAASSQAYKFTGKERDAESGLDYFGARFYSSNQGRWLIPDWSASPEAVPYADLSDPQSLNLYGYIRNNPMDHADTDGHCFPFCIDAADVMNAADLLNRATNAVVGELKRQSMALATDPKASGVTAAMMVAGAALPNGEAAPEEEVGETASVNAKCKPSKFSHSSGGSGN